MLNYNEVPFGTKYTGICVEADGDLLKFAVAFVYLGDSWGINIINPDGDITAHITDETEFTMGVTYENISFTVAICVENRGYMNSICIDVY